MPGGDCATRKAGSTPLFGRQSHQECHLWVRPAELNMSKKIKGGRAGLSKWQGWLLHPREILKNRTWTILSRKRAHAGEEEARRPVGERAGWGRNGPDGDVINTFVGQGKTFIFSHEGFRLIMMGCCVWIKACLISSCEVFTILWKKLWRGKSGNTPLLRWPKHYVPWPQIIAWVGTALCR